MGGLVQFVALVGFIPTSFSMMRMNSGLDHIVQEEMVINGMRNSNGGPPQPRTSSLVNSPLFSRFFTGRDDDGRGSFPRPPMPRQPRLEKQVGLASHWARQRGYRFRFSFSAIAPSVLCGFRPRCVIGSASRPGSRRRIGCIGTCVRPCTAAPVPLLLKVSPRLLS